jgi:general secretion pathway protein G
MTFVELVVVIAIIMILSAVALPVAKFSVKRQRNELRRNLRIIRDAIDAYHEAAMPTTPGAVPKFKRSSEQTAGPPTLEALVEGRPSSVMSPERKSDSCDEFPQTRY